MSQAKQRGTLSVQEVRYAPVLVNPRRACRVSRECHVRWRRATGARSLGDPRSETLGSDDSNAAALNHHGQIVGKSDDSHSTGDRRARLPLAGGEDDRAWCATRQRYSAATALNQRGHILGYSVPRSVITPSCHRRRGRCPAGNGGTGLTAINAQGEIVGHGYVDEASATPSSGR